LDIRDGERIEPAEEFGPDVFTDYLIEFMNRERDKPFFAYDSTILTHIPVISTPHNRDQDLSPREQLAGMLNYADHSIGRLEASLEASGQRDKTLIFIVVDNGTDQKSPQSLGGRINGRVSGEGIDSLTERGINMPLIVNWPNVVPGSGESDVLVDASDFLPTLAELADASPDPSLKIDGRSFASEVLGKPMPQDETRS